MSAEGTHWTVERVTRVIDGDTVRIQRTRNLGYLDGIEIIARDATPDGVTPYGVSVRLINLDTPERGQPGYDQAREDLRNWLLINLPLLRVITYPGGGFDRLLGDIYVAGDIGNTATQYMLRDRQWPPYVRGK